MAGYPLIFPINLFGMWKRQKGQSRIYAMERKDKDYEKRKVAYTGKKGRF